MFSEDIDTSYITKTKDTAKDIAIKIKNGNFYWASKKTEPGNQEQEQEGFTNPNNLILKNINMEIKKGSFVAILGELVFLLF